MKKPANYLFVFSLALIFAVCPLKSASAQTGLYVGIWGGYTLSPDAELDASPYHFDLDVQETWALGLKVGFTPPQAKYLAIEFEYSYLAPDIDRTVLPQAGADFAAIEADAKIHNFMFNVIAKYPVGRFHPYLGVGLGFSYVDGSATATERLGGVTSTTSVSRDDTTFAWQLLAGIDIDLTKNLTFDIGYRYFVINPEFDDAEAEFKTSMITFGLKYRF